MLEAYLIDNLEKEYNKYKIHSQKIASRKESDKKKRRPEQVKKEMQRLNVLFQKERIEWNYYNDEYEKLSDELSELIDQKPAAKADHREIEDMLKGDFRNTYNGLDLESKRSFWRSIIKEIHIDADHNITGLDFL